VLFIVEELLIPYNTLADSEKIKLSTLYPQKLALASPTSGGRSIDIVSLRTKDTE
jgi:hypothetical protein